MRILAIAYSCEPGKGSEPGAGWTWVRMLGSFADVHVITRENNRQPIEEALPQTVEADRLTFEYFDLPHPWRRWKRGTRRVRIYYLLWHVALARKLRRSRVAAEADLVWHLTIASVWLGSAAPLLRRPYILGPVGGGPNPPLRLMPGLGGRGVAYEIARLLLRGTSRLCNPLARLSWTRARLILVQNEETKDWLPRSHRRRSIVLQNAVVEEIGPEAEPRTSRRTYRALYAGRLLAWKGLSLAIRAIERSPDWHLVICGTGSDERRLRRLVRTHNVEDRVSFLGWRPREDVQREMKEADVFLFPSYHDDSPLAVVEALSAGVPVVCLDVGGPPLLAGSAGVSVRPSGIEATARALSEALYRAIGLRDAARKRARELKLEERALELERLARFVVQNPLGSGPPIGLPRSQVEVED